MRDVVTATGIGEQLVVRVPVVRIDRVSRAGKTSSTFRDEIDGSNWWRMPMFGHPRGDFAVSPLMYLEPSSRYADPRRTKPGEINHLHGGRGVYFDDPNGHVMEIITRPYGDRPEQI